MKLSKAKRFNTVESYAACACMATTCSCSPCTSCSCSNSLVFQSNKDSTGDRTAQSAYDRNYYDADASYQRG